MKLSIVKLLPALNVIHNQKGCHNKTVYNLRNCCKKSKFSIVALLYICRLTKK